jgi:hypothetical protein
MEQISSGPFATMWSGQAGTEDWLRVLASQNITVLAHDFSAWSLQKSWDKAVDEVFEERAEAWQRLAQH